MLSFAGIVLLATLSLTAGKSVHGRGEDNGISPIKTVSEGNQKFSFDLLEAIGSNQKNLIASPLSLYVALGFLSQGAKDTTKQQILKATYLPTDDDVTQAGFKQLLTPMMSTSNYTLDLADAMFVSKTCPVKKSFQDIAHTSFMTDVEAVDFSNTSSAADVINLWVRNSTADKITNLFNSGEVSSQTKLLLASTLYFHGSWENGFNSSKTKKLPFHVDSQTTVQTDMMTTMAEFRYAYYKDLDAEVVALDYKGGEVRMVIVLPGEVDGLEKLLSSISSLDQIKPGESPVRVEVTLPKFKAEQELDFIPILQKLGIRDVFTSAADLSGISEADQLTVSQVKQKAVLEVSEEGPVAAAITGTPGGGSQPIIHAFDADHGFVYFLQHVPTSSVMMFGTYTSPSS